MTEDERQKRYREYARGGPFLPTGDLGKTQAQMLKEAHETITKLRNAILFHKNNKSASRDEELYAALGE